MSKKKTGIQVNLWYRTKARSRDKFTETNVLSIGKQQKNISNGYFYLLLTVSKHFRLTQKKEVRMLFPARIELATFRVWGGRDNHYTTETTLKACAESIVDLCNESAKY